MTALGIARTFQTIRLFKNLTVRENVMSGLHPRTRAGVWGALARPPRQRAEEARIGAEADGVLERLGLERTIASTSRGTCPTGCSAGWSWRARWRRGRRCSRSTSRRRD